MELLLGYEILDSYQRLPYKIWYALAEFIDNSIQSYRNNPQLVEILKEQEKHFFVNINYENKSKNNPGFIRIEDNAWGMNESDLQNALTLGKKPEVNSGLSKYGLGLKTAAFWFGKSWTIETTQFGDEYLYTVHVDLNAILEAEKDFYEKQRNESAEKFVQFKPVLEIKKRKIDVNIHGTTIIINDLNRKFNASNVSTCKEYLRSIYRRDIEIGRVKIFLKGEELYWSQDEILNNLAVFEDGKKMYRKFAFVVNGKNVTGWAGVLRKGGRKYAGFSLLQADRVIQGFPTGYKPASIYGEDGGRNDLINQRLIGELNVDGFEVSHTKDQILFNDDEEIILETNLLSEIGDLKREAARMRVEEPGEVVLDIVNFELATSNIITSLQSEKFEYSLFEDNVLPSEAIEFSNDEVLKRIEKFEHEKYTANIGGLEVLILMSGESSIYDPYLITKSRAEKNKLTIIINKNHPYWNSLDSNSGFNFLQNCIYDGIAEWKAYFLAESLDPDTIKLIKDSFLRLKLNMEF